MKLTVVNAAVVLVGEAYNPLLFSYESVRNSKIAKKKWELIQPPITNPTVSLLRFDNKINLLVNPARAQTTIDTPPREISETPLLEVAEGVLRRLSNARHTGIGFNFAAIIEHKTPAQWLRNKFLKEGNWNPENISNVNLTISYPTRDALLQLSYADGIATISSYTENEQTYEGIIISANYHHDLETHVTIDAASRQAKQIIPKFSEYYEDFLATMSQVFELEDENHESAN